MFQVQALPHAAKFNFQVVLKQLECHLFAGVGDGEIDFAEAPLLNRTLDRKTVKRS